MDRLSGLDASFLYLETLGAVTQRELLGLDRTEGYHARRPVVPTACSSTTVGASRPGPGVSVT